MKGSYGGEIILYLWLWWWLHESTRDKTIHIHTHTHTQIIEYKTGEIWISSMHYTNVNFLDFILYYIYATCYHWGKLVKNIQDLPCMYFYNLLWIYNYFKVKNKNKTNKKTLMVRVWNNGKCWLEYKLVQSLLTLSCKVKDAWLLWLSV